MVCGVGEASNPGPPKFLRRLCRGVSSMSEPASTVPASVRNIHVAHRALEGGGVPAVVDMSLDDSDRESQGVMSSNRFEALSDLAEDFERKLSLPVPEVGVFVPACRPSCPRPRDTQRASKDDVEKGDVPEASVLETPILAERIQARARAFASLDSVNLVDTFYHRPRLMQAVPWVLRGAFRSPIQEALQKIISGSAANDVVKATRGWKLLLLLPRMILFRPSRGGSVPRTKLEARITSFQRGLWLELLAKVASCGRQGLLSQSAGGVVNSMMKGNEQLGLCPSCRWANCLRRDRGLKVRPWPQATGQLSER